MPLHHSPNFPTLAPHYPCTFPTLPSPDYPIFPNLLRHCPPTSQTLPPHYPPISPNFPVNCLPTLSQLATSQPANLSQILTLSLPAPTHPNFSKLPRHCPPASPILLPHYPSTFPPLPPPDYLPALPFPICYVTALQPLEPCRLTILPFFPTFQFIVVPLFLSLPPQNLQNFLTS